MRHALCTMPIASQQLVDAQLVPLFTEILPLLTACAALAVVAGFLSLIPAGAGVREFVIMTLLAADFGAVAAVASAILLRVVWMVSEVLLSGILYGSFYWSKRPGGELPGSEPPPAA